MNRINIYIALSLTFCLMFVTACSDEMLEQDNKHAQEVELPLVLSPVAVKVAMGTENSNTRAAAEENTIDNFWIMQYNSSGVLVNDPIYYDEIPSSVKVLLPVSGSYTTVVIANIGNSEPLTKENVGNIALLRAMSKDFTSYTSPSVFWMYGEKELKADDTSFECSLSRTLAKLNLKIINSSTDITINSIQVCNFPSSVYIADINKPKTGGYKSMDIIKETINAGSESSDMIYYLPSNPQTPSTVPTSQGEKTKYAPENATYVEIMATSIKDKYPLRYRFYPGGNIINDYNLLANHLYNMTIWVNDMDTDTDSSMEHLGTVRFESSNCYMIHPTADADSTRINGYKPLYRVPVTDRVNTYWKEYAEVKINPAIDDKTEWVAEVIWQDSQHQLIHFCDDRGEILNGNMYTGTGGEAFFFKYTNTGKECGNVLIGVRLASENGVNRNYLWSWHLWITDYNPDSHTAKSVNGQYKYPLDGGGELHRLEDGTGTVWANDYEYIMDRDLGSMSVSEESNTAAAGLFYQYGRKDPFPRPIKLYSIDGTELVDGTIYTKKSDDCIQYQDNASDGLYEGVSKPYCFYRVAISDWSDTNKYNNNPWNNPVSSDYKNKSFFDPSPPGWIIPHIDVWSVTETNDNGYILRKDNGVFLNFQKGQKATEALHAWVPFCGVRHDKDGYYLNEVTRYYQWGATIINDAKNAYCMYEYSGTFNCKRGAPRSRGMNIRCARLK